LSSQERTLRFNSKSSRMRTHTVSISSLRLPDPQRSSRMPSTTSVVVVSSSSMVSTVPQPVSPGHQARSSVMKSPFLDLSPRLICSVSSSHKQDTQHFILIFRSCRYRLLRFRKGQGRRNCQQDLQVGPMGRVLGSYEKQECY
jgi:hypothetical protein